MYQLFESGALNLGELLATTYKKLGLDETSYVFLVLFARIVKTNPTDWTLAHIADLMTVDVTTISGIFMTLIHDGFIVVNQLEDVAGKRHESYSLAPLFLKVETVMKKEASGKSVSTLKELSVKIEAIFGVLSPRDVELIGHWLNEDGFDATLIELALGEMQLHDIRSLKYVDKILLNWKRKNIFTIDEAKRSLIEFRRGHINPGAGTGEVVHDAAVYYDWIEQTKKELK